MALPPSQVRESMTFKLSFSASQKGQCIKVEFTASGWETQKEIRLREIA
jgi:hypothetical protein